jgi:hypothetical protein
MERRKPREGLRMERRKPREGSEDEAKETVGGL